MCASLCCPQAPQPTLENVRFLHKMRNTLLKQIEQVRHLQLFVRHFSQTHYSMFEPQNRHVSLC